jgi:hypothetical protein
MLAIVKEIKDGLNNTTRVFFCGWKPHNNNLVLNWGFPHLDGLRQCVLYKTKEEVKDILGKIKKEEKGSVIFVVSVSFVHTEV